MYYLFQVVCMKKCVVLLSVLLVSCNLLFAQKDKPVFSVTHETIGRNELLDADIVAKRYKFLQRVFTSDVNEELGVATIQLRDTLKKNGRYRDFGQVLVFDLNGDRVLWDKFINYSMDRVRTFGQFLIQDTKGMSEVYYTLAGNKVREVFGRFVRVYQDKQIGLVIPVTSGETKKRLVGVSMFSGDKLWQRKMDHSYGTSAVFRLNDSVVLIESGGLHTVNLDNGKGWDYEMKTARRDYSPIVGSLVGLTLGILSHGSAAFYMLGHNTKRMYSNIIVSDSAIYMAGREELVRLDLEGNVVWKYGLVEDVVTMSDLVLKDGVLYMINSGEVMKNGHTSKKQGLPFFAAFDANTGEQKYLTIYEKNGVFTGYDVKDRSIVLLQKDRVQVHALSEQIIMAENSCDTTVYGELLSFMGKRVYVERGNSFESLSDIDSSRVNILTSKRRVLIMGSALEILEDIPLSDLYFCYAVKGDYKFLLKDGKTIVLNRQNQRVASLDVDENSVIVGNVLYNISKTTYSVVDLSTIMINE